MAFLMGFCVSHALHAQDNQNVLNPKDKSVKRLESNQSFGGYTRTKIFYTFEKQSVILRLVIDNKTTKFPVTAELITFAKGTDGKALGKWLNNQTSDALYADAPNPVSKKNLGEGVCKVTKSKKQDSASVRGLNFDKYGVEFKLTKMGSVEGFSFKAFEDKATVYVKTK